MVDALRDSIAEARVKIHQKAQADALMARVVEVDNTSIEATTNEVIPML